MSLSSYLFRCSNLLSRKLFSSKRRTDREDYPTAFFNGMDFRLATYTGGPTYVPDHLGVLRSPGANKPACQGFRLDGTTYRNTDESGNQIITSTPQKTVTYNTDWTAKTFAETFDKFDISDPLKAPGWLCEPARTNRITSQKSIFANLTGITYAGGATGAVVADTVAIAASPLANISSGNVAEFTIPAGGQVIFPGTVANTNKHSASIFSRLTSGASVVLQIEGSTGVAITSANYSRVLQENVTPADTTKRMTLYNPNVTESVVRCSIPQLEDGAFCTSPICKLKDGSDPLTAITRAGTVLAYPTAGKIRSNNQAFRIICIPRAYQLYHHLFNTYISSSNRLMLYLQLDKIGVASIKNGINTTLSRNYVYTINQAIEIIVILSSTAGMIICSRSLPGGAWLKSQLTTSIDDKVIATTYALGSENNISQVTGNISLFDTLLLPEGLADPLAYAKEKWRLPA